MLSVEDRINLRDELIILFYNFCEIIHKRNLTKILSNNPELQSKYNIYVSEFRSEDEALYCLRQKDDPSNHICPICGNICEFYVNIKNSHYEYRKACKNEVCIDKIIHTKEARKKAEDTCLNLYGNKNIFAIPAFRAKADETKEYLYGNKNYNNREKCRDTKQKRYGDPNYNNIEKMIETIRNLYGVDWYFQTEEFKRKSKETNRKKRGCDYPTQDPIVQEIIKTKFLLSLGVDNPSKSEIIKELKRKTYIKNNYGDIIDIIKIESILKKFEKDENNQFHPNIEYFDLYSNNEYLINLILELYKEKKTLLRLKDLSSIFKVTNETIYKRIKQVKMTSYFYVPDSMLELQFRDFLINNGFIEKEDFERRNHNILPINDKTKRHLEIDFYFRSYNIGFEINDTDGHNYSKKDMNYHYNKSIQCLQLGKRLIHLWEWELNETNWPKISQWILHILNHDKIQLNIFENDNYNIKRVNEEDEQKFLNKYSIITYQESDICIGIYYNNELIQTISFKDNILSICVKFGYNIIEGTKEIIESYIKFKNLDHIITYIDLSKFTGNTITELGFKLLKYQEPDIISEIDTTIKSKQVYNCGYNVYILTN